MRNIVSNIEGTWKEIKRVELTTEQKELLKSQKEEDKASKLVLQNTIREQREISVTPESVTIFNAIYNKVKPTLKDSDVYQLIAINISYGEKTFGILNCRVNGEHKQFRF
jgi:transcriptional regulator with GAF, ATPase, and Fis domain